ncbi:nickel-dependent hydrogenase large subunit [Sulfurospirillum arsenophilum]|uniref:nickel-dependent hydrogenase large subunit n=1 Tax=Sulfurospirillum arsenophilum TaxID=56698 RepID=UPI0005AA959C|nr:nickel-dependent hydrogenase large subunit [Sulfurospirillum arsenophilum]
MKITKEIIQRIEGEATLELEWEKEQVSFAKIKFFNYRGIEEILKKRPLLDALALTPKVCGICSHSHAIASVLAIEECFKSAGESLHVNQKAKDIREIALNAEKIQNHIKWYFFTILPELKRVSDPTYKGNAFKEKQWFQAQRAIMDSLKMGAHFTGQWPHGSFVMAGGVTCDPLRSDLISAHGCLDAVIAFCEEHFYGMSLEEFLSFDSALQVMSVPSALSFGIDEMLKHGFDRLGRSFDRFLALGESFMYEGSLKASKTTVLGADVKYVHESLDHTFFADKNSGYTYSKSAMYKKSFCEVGPLSRLMVAKEPLMRDFHRRFKDAALTRVVARAVECAHLLWRTKALLQSIDLKEASLIPPKKEIHGLSGEGVGVIEAPRGSLIHHVVVHQGIIESYDIITPTVWNLGNGDKQNPSTAQKALIGLNSFTKADFVLKSFDVCSVCTTQ